MRTYRGIRSAGDNGISVIVTEEAGQNVMAYPLPIENAASLLERGSECEFEWGFIGGRPALLALAILLDATGSIRVAKQCYEAFEWQHVLGWGDCWEITSDAIATWIATSGVLREPGKAGSTSDCTSRIIKEALDPASFVVTETVHHDPELGARIAAARKRLAEGGAP